MATGHRLIRALRSFLERWLNTKATYPTAAPTRTASGVTGRTRPQAGFEVLSTTVDYVTDLDLDQLVGGVYSALGGRPDCLRQISGRPSRAGPCCPRTT